MKAERVYLDELNPSSRAYKVKVKVIEKGRARPSPKKGTIYQHLLLQDDKGNRMWGALFGDQIEGYKEAFMYNGEYEIANAPIKPSEDQWKSSPAEVTYQMNFGRQTVIQRVNSQSDTVLPEYQCIASIPKAGDPDTKFDVLGVVLYVEDNARTIVTTQNHELLVREIVISDHSIEQPLIISAWNDLAGDECDSLSSWAEKFSVVGFTALRISAHKGFSLASSMSTNIIHDPKGDRANALQEWALHHKDVLSNRQARVLDVRNPSKERVIMTLDALRLKKPHNTLQEERRWLRVIVLEANIDKVNAYLGCSHCGKRTDVPIGMAYACTTCSKKDCISSPRVTFNCEVSDGTGTLSITTFTEDSEKLFRMTAPDIFRIKHFNDLEAFTSILQLLRTSHVLIEVGPKTTLSRNNVLQWVLKQVVLEDEPDDAQVESVVTPKPGNHAATEPKNVATAESNNVPDAHKIVPTAERSNVAVKHKLLAAQHQIVPAAHTENVPAAVSKSVPAVVPENIAADRIM